MEKTMERLAHWIDNADSYICSCCKYESNNPNKEKFGPNVCPRCFSRMDNGEGKTMERLTDWDFLAGVRTGDLRLGVDERKAFDRLAAYEDTGYMPGEFEAAVDALKAHLWDVEQELKAYRDTGLEPEEIDELLHKSYGPLHKKLGLWICAEKDGRLVVLPCKVGDTLWTNIAIVGDRYKSADRPYPVEVVFIGMGKDDRFFHVQYEGGTVFPFDYDKFGKNVFLTREEAEAAMKNTKGGKR